MSRKRPLDEGVETTKRSNKGIKKKYIKTDESVLRRGSGIVRCEWGDMSDAMRRYHDEEWGVFRDDDRFLFEMLTLEGNITYSILQSIFFLCLPPLQVPRRD